jgi:hypothetical protein
VDFCWGFAVAALHPEGDELAAGKENVLIKELLCALHTAARYTLYEPALVAVVAFSD